MILRRFIAHFKKQEWTAIVIDFVIVVMGVFVGLQVSNWNAARADRAREAQIVADLLADLEIDRAEFANGLAADARRAATANAALTGAGLQPIRFDWKKRGLDRIDYSFDLPAGDADDQRPDRLWSDIVLGYHPGPSTATIDALIGAGEMRIIRDRAIVRAIQDYRTLTASVIQQNDKRLAIRADVLKIGASYGLAPYQDMPEPGVPGAGRERARARGGDQDHGDVRDLSSRRAESGGGARRGDAGSPARIPGDSAMILRRAVKNSFCHPCKGRTGEGSGSPRKSCFRWTANPAGRRRRPTSRCKGGEKR